MVGMDSSMSDLDLDAMTAVTDEEEAILRGDVELEPDPFTEDAPVMLADQEPPDYSTEDTALDHVANRVLEKLGPAIGHIVQQAVTQAQPPMLPAQINAEAQMATLYAEAVQSVQIVENCRQQLTAHSQGLVAIVNRLDAQNIPSGIVLQAAQFLSQMASRIDPLLGEMRKLTESAHRTTLA